MSSVQRKTSDVFRAGFLTVDGTLDSNNSQLYFRPLQYPYQPTSGYYYSLSPAQQSDPTIRINQWNVNGTLKDYGYLYDTQFNPLPPGSTLLLAGGDASSVLIYTQDNGSSWSRSANGSTLFNKCLAIAYNGYIWVAGGDITSSAKLIYSSDGINWNNSLYGTGLFLGGSCNAIATNGKLWVAGGTSTILNTVLYSYDGITWHPSSGTTLLGTSCLTVAWNGTMWIAGGVGDYRIIYSYDGITWLGSNANTALTGSCKALAWNGSIWLAGGTGTNKMAFSYDGINWTALTQPFNADVTNSCNTIAWSGSQWVAGGTESAYNTLIYSSDGFTWSNAVNDSQLFRICNAVTWTGKKWIAGGYQTTYPFLTSTDGITWTPLYSANAYLWKVNAIANNTVLPTVAPSDPVVPTNPIVLMGGAFSTIARSTDGITWTPIVSADIIFFDGTCYALTWNGSNWVAGLDGTNRLGYSYDGLSWNTSASGSLLLTTACYTVADGSGIWLAGGEGTNRIIKSADGVNWDASFPVGATNPNTVFGNNSCKAIAYNGFKWVAASDSTANRIAQSSNGLSWTGCPTANAIFTSFCRGIAWNGQIWVAVGDTGKIAYSSDGITWTAVTTDITSSFWNSVAWNGNLWVVGGSSVGSSEPLAYSYDGLNWTKSINGKTILGNNCTSVAWTGTLWVATGLGIDTVSAYSYNGIAWTSSYNSAAALSLAQTIGVNRPLTNVGAAVPPTTLITNSATKKEGFAVFNSALTDLYPSSALYISDISGSVGINCIPSTHENDSQRGPDQFPSLDISGQLTYIRAGGRNVSGVGGVNEWPELVLSNESQNNTMRQYAGRITMQKDAQNEAWSIDALENGGLGPGLLLQFNHWTVGNTSNVAMSLDALGNVGIGCIPPASSIFKLDICGNANIRNNLSVLGDISGNHATIRDISANSLSLQTLYIPDISGVNTITTNGSIASQLSLTNRGSGLITIDMSNDGADNPPYHSWTKTFPIPNPSADGYKTYLVTVNCVFDASNADPKTVSYVTVNGDPVTEKYFLAGPTGQSLNYYPLSFTFIITPTPGSGSITVAAFTDTTLLGGNRCEFINKDSGTPPNLLTTVEITGLA